MAGGKATGKVLGRGTLTVALRKTVYKIAYIEGGREPVPLPDPRSPYDYIAQLRAFIARTVAAYGGAASFDKYVKETRALVLPVDAAMAELLPHRLDMLENALKQGDAHAVYSATIAIERLLSAPHQQKAKAYGEYGRRVRSREEAPAHAADYAAVCTRMAELRKDNRLASDKWLASKAIKELNAKKDALKKKRTLSWYYGHRKKSRCAKPLNAPNTAGK